MLLLLISFIAGFLTILAPCVLPLLPIIVGGSVSGNSKQKSRPYIIAGSLALSVIVFTLLLKLSTSFVNVSPNALTSFSGGLIIALGLVSVFPDIWEKLVIKVNFQAASQRFLGKNTQAKGKFIGPVLIGVALGPVFSSCSPTYAFILASVLPKSFLAGLIYLITYSIALVIGLLLVSLLGKRLISHLHWAVDTHSIFRRVVGIIFIFVGIAIISGQEIKIETWVGNHLPFDETRLEQTLLAKQHTSIAPSLKNSGSENSNPNDSVLNVQPTPSPQLVGLTNWINSPPLQISKLRGKVILVDFWTYSCVNCNRAIPHVEALYKNYSSYGLVVIGVSTPEFAFEHNPTNVANAVKADGITYPVALDNNYDTWNAFDNDSWPADYLIDKSGNIRYVNLGEGNYQQTEQAVQALLGINQPLKDTNSDTVPISNNQTDETYFGTNRDSDYAGSPGLNNGSYDFKAVSTNNLPQNFWTLNGQWQIAAQPITSESNSSVLTFNIEAKDVYVVAGSTNNQPRTVSVGLSTNASGQYASDDSNGQLVVSGSGLYHIVSLKQFGNATVTLTVPTGVSLYTFTFGS
ncbi:MAG TPA: cytochrome c biogenesis protein CcdA [Candidatus Saccharimonadales bacterium]|nr:cytochrome c biogenesis protein CcdA [Candidatus Saccharimonadales bacterium]